MWLSSARIRDLRRFETAQTIQFCSGVTVVLAPNGTGKTALFEAIELATNQMLKIQEQIGFR